MEDSELSITYRSESTCYLRLFLFIKMIPFGRAVGGMVLRSGRVVARRGSNIRYNPYRTPPRSVRRRITNDSAYRSGGPYSSVARSDVSMRTASSRRSSVGSMRSLGSRRSSVASSRGWVNNFLEDYGGIGGAAISGALAGASRSQNVSSMAKSKVIGNETNNKHVSWSAPARKKKRRISKKKRKGKKKVTMKKVRKMIKAIAHKSPGRKAKFEYLGKYYLTTSGDVNFFGNLKSDPNYAGHGFIPLFNDTQMKAEFGIGNTGSGIGLLAPPPLQDNITGNQGLNLVKKQETIIVDKCNFTLYLTNTNDTRASVQIRDWVCNQSDALDPIKRIHQCYTEQQIANTALGYTNIGSIAVPNLWKHPFFKPLSIPGVSKFWKKGAFKKSFVMGPGESLTVHIPYKNLRWNQELLAQDNAGTGTGELKDFEYKKGISHFIQISTRGMVGADAYVEGGQDKLSSALQATSINFMFSKTVTMHREDVWGSSRKGYAVNLPASYNQPAWNLAEAANVQEAGWLDTVTLPVSSYIESVENTS